MRVARESWPFAEMDQRLLTRATHVQDALAARSQHRGAKIADLLIAAAAEAAELVVLHCDRDFDHRERHRAPDRVDRSRRGGVVTN